MEQPLNIPAPVSLTDRIKSIDTIRGVALLGILMMNIPGFALNFDFFWNIVTGPRTGGDYYAFAGVFVLFEGTMRGLFSMLFGAVMILFMQNKKQVPGATPVSVYYFTGAYCGWYFSGSSMHLSCFGLETFYFSTVSAG